MSENNFKLFYILLLYVNISAIPYNPYSFHFHFNILMHMHSFSARDNSWDAFKSSQTKSSEAYSSFDARSFPKTINIHGAYVIVNYVSQLFTVHCRNGIAWTHHLQQQFDLINSKRIINEHLNLKGTVHIARLTLYNETNLSLGKIQFRLQI